VINVDPHNQREKGLILVPTLEERQCGSTPTSLKASSGQLSRARSPEARLRHPPAMWWASLRERPRKMSPPLLVQETSSLPLLLTGAPPTSKTRSGKQYLKQYSDPVTNFLQPVEAIELSTRPSMEKQKELRYDKALPKKEAGASTPFRFDVLTQLTNISARITLYKLWCFLSLKERSKRSNSRYRGFCNPNFCYMSRRKWQPLPPCLEAVFLHHLHSRRQQVKGKHDRRRYCTGYIRSSKVNRIQVYPGCITHYALQGHATFRDPHPSVERHLDNHL